MTKARVVSTWELDFDLKSVRGECFASPELGEGGAKCIEP
jgi:hypothetical protein